MADQNKAIADARAAMIAKRFGGNSSGASTGGAGTMRRKNKGVAKTTGGRIVLYPLFAPSCELCLRVLRLDVCLM
jgi:hypothetical protein